MYEQYEIIKWLNKAISNGLNMEDEERYINNLTVAELNYLESEFKDFKESHKAFNMDAALEFFVHMED